MSPRKKTKASLVSRRGGKLVAIWGSERTDRLRAEKDLDSLLSQEGAIGGCVLEDEIRRTRPGTYYSQVYYDRVYTAVMFTVFDIGAPMPHGVTVASRKMAARCGVRVPRGVDA